MFVRIRFLVTIVPRNDKNKRNILGMTKIREISSEWQKQEKYHWNDKNKKCHPELFPFVILNVSEGSFVASLLRGAKKNVIRSSCDVPCHSEHFPYLSSRTNVRDLIPNYWYFLDFSKTSITFICYFWFIVYHHHY